MKALERLIPSEILDLQNIFLKRAILGIALAAMAIRVVFWAYTGRVWEDALITVLHSENFSLGLGLTHYHPGQAPLHGFTSPLSVLIPLMADMVKTGWGLPFLKCVSVVAGFFTVLYAAAIGLNPQLKINTQLLIGLLLFLACEHHQILWGMSGMETQVSVLILFFTTYQVLHADWKKLGIALALCIYTRPDFLFFTMIVGVCMLKNWRAIRNATFLAVALYVPWILFTTLYYGSPIPNTIIAKSMGYQNALILLPMGSYAFHHAIEIYKNFLFAFMPSFAGHGTNYHLFIKGDLGDFLVSFYFSVIICGFLTFPFHATRTRAVFYGFSFVYAFYYLYAVPAVFGWYLVPYVAMTAVVFVDTLTYLFGLAQTRVKSINFNYAEGMLAALWVVPLILVLPVTFKTEKQIQEEIETPVRIAIGKYIHDNGKPGETVGAEPLGFISYYSRHPVFDWPGLCSREVTQFNLTHPDRRSLYDMLDGLRPDWIVLRSGEIHNLSQRANSAFLLQSYHFVKTFEASPADTDHIMLSRFNIDRSFTLFKKNEIAKP